MQRQLLFLLVQRVKHFQTQIVLALHRELLGLGNNVFAAEFEQPWMVFLVLMVVQILHGVADEFFSLVGVDFGIPAQRDSQVALGVDGACYF